jgi:BRO1-like domain/ALIX V-shaped domain binding to HIV
MSLRLFPLKKVAISDMSPTASHGGAFDDIRSRLALGDPQPDLLKEYLAAIIYLSGRSDFSAKPSVWTSSLKPNSARSTSVRFFQDKQAVIFNLALMEKSPLRTIALFEYLKAEPQQEMPSFDLQADSLDFLISMFKAQAQTDLMEKSSSGALKMKLATEAASLWSSSKSTGKKLDIDKSMADRIELEIARCTLTAHWMAAQATVEATKKSLNGFGMLAARFKVCTDELNKAMAILGSLKKATGSLSSALAGIESSINAIAAELSPVAAEIIRDNDLVYHEPLPMGIPEIPRVNGLGAIPDGAQIVQEYIADGNSRLDLQKFMSPAIQAMRESLATKLDSMNLNELQQKRNKIVTNGGFSRLAALLSQCESTAILCENLMIDANSLLRAEAEEDGMVSRMPKGNKRARSQMLNKRFVDELTVIHTQLNQAKDANREMSIKILGLQEFIGLFKNFGSSSSTSGPSDDPLKEIASLKEEILKDMEKFKQMSPMEANTAQQSMAREIEKIGTDYAKFANAIELLENCSVHLDKGSQFFNSASDRLNRLVEEIKGWTLARNIEAQSYMY